MYRPPASVRIYSRKYWTQTLSSGQLLPKPLSKPDCRNMSGLSAAVWTTLVWPWEAKGSSLPVFIPRWDLLPGSPWYPKIRCSTLTKSLMSLHTSSKECMPPPPAYSRQGVACNGYEIRSVPICYRPKNKVEKTPI